MKKKIALLMIIFGFSTLCQAEVLKDVGKKIITKEESQDIDKINLCEKQKRCKSYIDMTNYDDAKFIVEMPEKLFNSFKTKGGVHALYWGIMMIAKGHAPSALLEFTNNKQVYKNTVANGLNTPKERIFMRLNIGRIEQMNNIIIKDKNKILANYIIEDSKK